jgi:translation initiation factor 2 beta subunit (eIF-2beta)/eIF-5
MTICQKGITALQQILYNNYTIMPESNEDSVLLIQKKHVMGTLTYSLKEPLKISPSHDTIIIRRFKARKIRENVYEVTQKFLSTEDQLTTPIHESPDLR